MIVEGSGLSFAGPPFFSFRGQFLDLRNQAIAIQDTPDAGIAGQEFRRHSVATCMGVDANNSASYMQQS